MPKQGWREWAIEPRPGADSLPGVAAETPPRTSRRGSGVAPQPKLRALRARRRSPPKRGGGGLVGTSRSGRLQGLAPLTSPLRHVAVASDSTLVSSMGFVIPSKVPCPPHHPGDASTGESFTVEPELGLGRPLPESPRQAVAAGADGIPAVVHSFAHCRSRRGETAVTGLQSWPKPGKKKEPDATPFQRSGGTRCRALIAPRPKPWWRVWAVPPESVRKARW